MSDSFQPHGLQHARLLFPPPSPRVCSSSCPLSRLCYLTISSSATLFSFCLQSLPTQNTLYNFLQIFLKGPAVIDENDYVLGKSKYPDLLGIMEHWLLDTNSWAPILQRTPVKLGAESGNNWSLSPNLKRSGPGESVDPMCG